MTHGLHFAAVGNSPGMRGVDAQLRGDADGLRLRFEPGAPVAFDWPAGFGMEHEVSLGGEAVLWREGAGWTVHTPGLAILGRQLDVNARGGIGFGNDGTCLARPSGGRHRRRPVTSRASSWSTT
ncbi:MAG: hypothetical protein IPO74_10445 [Thermomonas sp.]|nr:hypothetical protein [Thermomonas sp.]